MSVLFKNVLRKIAAGDDGAKTKPNPIAMVGNYPYNHKNIGKSEILNPTQPLGGRGNPYFDALHDNSLDFRNASNIDLPDTVQSNYVLYGGTPITTVGLNRIRRSQAGSNTYALMGENTPQSRSAYQYLLQRGAENEALFKSGDLYKGGPRPKSKIQLPANIKDPAKRKMLEQYGNIQVNNNIPGGGRGQGFGIG